MPPRRRSTSKPTTTRRPPATTPDGRESQLISLAVDLAEQQMRDGTASAQVISHYLKLGSSRERLEQSRLAKENDLLDVKKEAYEAHGRVEELYMQALDSMRAYAGHQIASTQDDRYDD